MTLCEMCGNDYDQTFEVRMAGRVHVFDSFECAVHRLAPRCDHCECTIIGHGVQADDRMYCCASCATRAGVSGLRDRA